MNDSKYIESLSKEIEERILDDVAESIHDLIPDAVRESVQMIDDESKDKLVEMDVDKLADAISELLDDAGAHSIICIEKDNDYALLGGMDAISIVAFVSTLITMLSEKAKCHDDDILDMISDGLYQIRKKEKKEKCSIKLKK